MKLLIVGILIYMGYRLISPREDVHIEDSRSKHLTDDDYIDYEEVD